MKITSSTDREFPGLRCAIRQGEVKDLGIGQQQVPEFMCIRERRGSSTWAGNRQRRFAYFA